MKMKTLLASLAVASLAVAQPVSAATRSIDSLPTSGIQSTAAADRIGSLSDAEAEDLRGRPLLIIILLFGSLAALIALLSDDDGQSPG